MNSLYILIGRYYQGARRRLAQIPFIYQIYRRCPPLQKMDVRAIRTLERMSMLQSLPARDHDAVQQIQDLLLQKQYRDVLRLSEELRRNQTEPNSTLLNWITQACVALKEWDLFDKKYYPAMQEMARFAIVQNSAAKKEYCQGTLEDAALAMLQNARLKMARQLLLLADSVITRPRYALLADLVQFIETQQKEALERAQTVRAKQSAPETNVIGSIVWGEKYLDAFLRYNVRSMLSPGNMPYLRTQGALVHSIITTEAGRDYVRKHAVYPELCKVAQVEFFCFPDRLLDLFKGEDGPDKWSYLLYGILDHINLFFARALQANLFLIPVDAIVADPSFSSMHRYFSEGYDCCGAGNLVAEREGFLAALDKEYGDAPALTIGTRELATLALRHPHQYITSQLIHDGNHNFGKHARELFWPVEGGIAVHSIYTHPLAIAARRLCGEYDLPYSWVDFLLAPRLFPEPAEFSKYKIIENAEEAYINNFAPASRQYETTGRAFDPEDFVAVHTYSYPIHRHMLTTRQFIPCDKPPLVYSGNIRKDEERIHQVLRQCFETNTASASAARSDNPCHLCESNRLREAIDLGEMPLSHQLRRSLQEPEKKFPVRFHYCTECGLLQMSNPIPPDALYDADTYATGFQKPRHIDDLITQALSWRPPGSVLDIGCNDGSLLRALEGYGFTQLTGIEPNKYAAAIAAQNIAHTIYMNYLSLDLAESMRTKHKPFDFIFMRHVLEHVTDIGSFFRSLDRLLSADGLLVLELPRVEVGFAANNPVILWEEHVNYFTEPTVKAMLKKYGYEVIAQCMYAFGGGSNTYLAKRASPAELDLKASRSLPFQYYQRYAQAIGSLKYKLGSVLDQAKNQGYSVVLYGAAPRSCTLVNFAQIGTQLDWVIDDRSNIQNRYLPGTDKPIVPLEQCKPGTKVLVLLGVGAENEHLVKDKLARSLGCEPVTISLFPPRDIYASLSEAAAKLSQATSSARLKTA